MTESTIGLIASTGHFVQGDNPLQKTIKKASPVQTGGDELMICIDPFL